MGFTRRIEQISSRSAAESDVETVLARMEELVAAERCTEAVAYGDRAAHAVDDMHVHRRLTGLRREAVVEAVRAARPRAEWPPRLPDPFPGLVGIPEIGPAALDTATMGGAILHHGSVLVRGLLDRDEAMQIADGIDDAYDDHDRLRDTDHDPGRMGLLSPFPFASDDPLAITRSWLRSIGGLLAADCPSIFTRLVRFYERHGLIAAIEGYLGERPLLSVGKTVLRRIEPGGIGDFHQDGAFLGAAVRTINVWIALSDCGVDAPGLEVVDRRVPTIIPPGINDARHRWSVGRGDALAANDGRPFAVPSFRAGDALVFDQMMLHSTGFTAGMDRRRYALEAWFFAPSAYPEDQIPLLI